MTGNVAYTPSDCSNQVSASGKGRQEERQSIQIATMREVVKFLDEKGLCYFLAYGGVLGYRRHNGRMIPWDDDVDLIMPRDYYELAVKGLRSNGSFAVWEYTKDTDFRVMPVKVALKKNVENMASGEVKMAYIDIFALDAVCVNKIAMFLRRKLSVLVANVILYRAGINHGWKKMISAIMSLIMPRDILALKRLFVRLWHKKIGFDKWTPSTFVGEANGAYGVHGIMEWGVYLGDNGECGRRGMFEGVAVNLPFHVEKYLKNIYGEWEVPPPIESRSPKHLYDDPWFYSELRVK